MTTTVLSATTSAGQSDEIRLDSNSLPCHIYTETLGTGETATVQIKVDGSWQDYSEGGTVQECDEDNTGVLVVAPGVYRVDKSATASATGVYISLGNRA